MSILQHRSTESFRRELQRNPHLMLTLGFQIKGCEGSDDGDPDVPYRVPSAAAFSRVRKQLCQLEAETGVIKAQFLRHREELLERLPDFAKDIGFDGRAIQSHSTGQKLPNKLDPRSGEQLTSDPDARWAVTSSTAPMPMAKKKSSRNPGSAICCMWWRM